MYKGKKEKIEHPFRLLFKTLALAYKDNLPLTIITFILLILSSGVSILVSYMAKDLLTAAEGIIAMDVIKDYSSITRIIIIMGLMYLVGTICSSAYQLILVRITQKALYKTRCRLFSRMEKLPISYFDQRTTGEVMSVYTNDVETLRQTVSQAIPQLLTSFIQIVLSVTMMFILSWLLTLIAIFSIILIVLVVSFIGKRSGKYFIKQQVDLSKMNGYIEEMTKGQKVIKVFNHEEEAILGFKGINDGLEDSNFKANFYAAVMMPIVNNINYIGYAASCLIAALVAINNPTLLSIPSLVAFLLLDKNFGMPFTQISSQINFIFQGLAGSKRIFELLETEEEKDDGYVKLVNVTYSPEGKITETDKKTQHWAWKNPHHEEGNNLTPLKGDIKFFDVDFSYIPGKLVLKDVSLYAEPGQKIAFVGATGAGKTTITNLINRFYDIADGKIKYDGININKIKKDDLRKSLAIVLQDTHLFTETIEANIKYGRQDATHEEVVNAAKLANADSFISRLPEGYNTVITGDGASLSQGQRQLISIARAAITDPPVLILDEATSSIDTYTEHLIQEGMDKLMKGRTTFAIAHRLSTVENSDAIMVLDHGQIIERGNHNSLIEKKGVYYQLYMGAFELE